MAIIKSRTGFKAGLLAIVGVIPISIGYLLPGLVNAVEGRADMNMSMPGALLVFGTLGLQILITCLVYFAIYYQTRNYGSKMMFSGLIIVLLSSVTGLAGDILAGESGRYLDPIGYALVLIGLGFFYTGFKQK